MASACSDVGDADGVETRTSSAANGSDGTARCRQSTSRCETTSPPQLDVVVPEPVDRAGGSSHPCEAPPSYEQSLEHRRLEYGSYPAASQLPTLRRCEDGQVEEDQPEMGLHRNSLYLHQHSSVWTSGVETINVPAEDTLSVMTERELEETCIRMTLPPMHMAMAITCLVFNFLIPGLGTMMAAAGVFCCTRSNEWTHEKKCGSCSLNLCIGLTQLLLTPFLLIGWVWSVLWGFAFVGISQQHYHGPKRQAVAPYDIHNVVAQGPPSYSQINVREPAAVPQYAATTAAASDSTQQQLSEPCPQEDSFSIVEVHAAARSRTNGTENSRDVAARAVDPRAPPNEQTASARQMAGVEPGHTANNTQPDPDRNILENGNDCSATRARTSLATRRNSVTHNLAEQSSGEMIGVSN